MFDEEIPIAESPQYTDAGNARIACRGNIHITVAHIHCILGSHAQLPHCLEDSVGSRFATYILSLAYCHLDSVGKEMLAELDGGIVKFITHHSHIASH